MVWPRLLAAAAGSFVRNTQQTYLGGANAVDAKYLASYGTQVVRQPRLLPALPDHGKFNQMSNA